MVPLEEERMPDRSVAVHEEEIKHFGHAHIGDSLVHDLLDFYRRCSLIRLLRFQRGHVDREPVLHIRLKQSVVSFVDFLDRYDFHIGCDVVLPAEIEHFLGLPDTANIRAGEVAIAHNQGECSHTERLGRRAENREITVAGEQVHVCIDVVISGNRVENEIEAGTVFKGADSSSAMIANVAVFFRWRLWIPVN